MILPHLKTLRISEMAYLNYFIGLRSLKNIYSDNYEEIDNIDEIFDPNKIILLQLSS